MTSQIEIIKSDQSPKFNKGLLLPILIITIVLITVILLSYQYLQESGLRKQNQSATDSTTLTPKKVRPPAKSSTTGVALPKPAALPETPKAPIKKL